MARSGDRPGGRSGDRPSDRLRILGIDPGTRTLGYGLVERAKGRAAFEYVECGLVKPPERAPMIERLLVIATTLSEILTELRPDEVALETAFHGRNAASALKLGQARGAIMVLVAQAGLPLSEYAPAQIKQVVVGHGRATKEDVQQRVRLLLRMKRVPATDAADALAIALCHGTRLPAGHGVGHDGAGDGAARAPVAARGAGRGGSRR